MPFYAIAQGTIPGIVNTWMECKNRIDGYKNAIYKKFDLEEEAEVFILKNTVKPKPKSNLDTKIVEIEQSDFIPDYYVYTDGACSNNGAKSAEAGIGIYFGENDPRNVSQRVDGKQTNNTAELGALQYLYKIIRSDILQGKKIGIVSDSVYAIRCVTSYGSKCDKENWQKDIPNKEMVKTVYDLYKDHPNVRFIHIMAHTDKTDIHSMGNDGADKLANLAIGLENCPYNDTRIFLSVPYLRKEEAKALGARWETTKKQWYTFQNSENRAELESLFSK
jgi:ribonuclease HI